MIDLIAKSPVEGLLPHGCGGRELSEVAPGAIHVIAPFRTGRAEAEALLAGAGVSLPPPGQSSATKTARLLWTGPGQYFRIADAPPDEALSGCAAVTDVSDGWVMFRLSGPGTEATLARLVPVDLRPAAFATGSVVRSLLGHVPVILLRGTDAIELLVMRSYAVTAVHDITAAMASQTAREAMAAR